VFSFFSYYNKSNGLYKLIMLAKSVSF